MNKKTLILGCLLGLLSVLLGAFGAHGLKSLVSEASITSFETGVRYQMYHALLLLFIGSTAVFSNKTKNVLFYLIGIGVLFFSGSIYGLATINLSAFDFKAIAFVTPIGGLLLVVAWIILLIKVVKVKSN